MRSEACGLSGVQEQTPAPSRSANVPGILRLGRTTAPTSARPWRLRPITAPPFQGSYPARLRACFASARSSAYPAGANTYTSDVALSPM